MKNVHQAMVFSEPGAVPDVPKMSRFLLKSPTRMIDLPLIGRNEASLVRLFESAFLAFHF